VVAERGLDVAASLPATAALTLLVRRRAALPLDLVEGPAVIGAAELGLGTAPTRTILRWCSGFSPLAGCG
jgi:hypothetical protein